MGSPQRTAARAAARKRLKSRPTRLISSPEKHPFFGIAYRLFDAPKNRSTTPIRLPRMNSSLPPTPKNKSNFIEPRNALKSRPAAPIVPVKRPARAGNTRNPGTKYRIKKR